MTFQGGMLPLAPVKKVVQNLGSPAGSVISIDETLKICRFKLYVCIFSICFAKILCFEIENSSGLGPFLPSFFSIRGTLSFRLSSSRTCLSNKVSLEPGILSSAAW